MCRGRGAVQPRVQGICISSPTTSSSSLVCLSRTKRPREGEAEEEEGRSPSS